MRTPCQRTADVGHLAFWLANATELRALLAAMAAAASAQDGAQLPVDQAPVRLPTWAPARRCGRWLTHAVQLRSTVIQAPALRALAAAVTPRLLLHSDQTVAFLGQAVATGLAVCRAGRDRATRRHAANVQCI